MFKKYIFELNLLICLAYICDMVALVSVYHACALQEIQKMYAIQILYSEVKILLATSPLFGIVRYFVGPLISYEDLEIK